MEKWSRYNYILNSDTIGKFIYNSRTNCFIKINDNLYRILKDNNRDISLLKENIKISLKTAKVIVEEGEDDHYFFSKKLAKYASAFSRSFLSLTIATTTNCNFRCPYCYEKNAIKSTSTDKVNNAIIKYIRRNEAKDVSITWYGGEPLLNFEAIKYITEKLKNKYFGKKISYSIVTNGYLLDKEKVAFFKEYNLKSVQITLDGLKETNDKTRILANGKGSFDTIIKNIAFAINEMPECFFVIRVNTDKYNIDEYPKLHKFIKDKFQNNKNIYVYHSYIRDRTDKSTNCIEYQRQANHNLILAEKHSIIDFETYPSFKVGGCTANLINGYVIDPEGHLCKCWEEVGDPSKIVGTLMNDKVITNQRLLINYLVNADMFDDRLCKKCFLFPVCHGGCPYQRILTGNENGINCAVMPKDIGAYLELHYKNHINAK